MSSDGSETFRTATEGYGRHVGRYGPTLSAAHIAAAAVRSTDRVLDVGCGPGTLTRALAELVGPERVAAVDPSEAFVAACRALVPDVDVRVGTAESLPVYEAAFDVVLAQLVVNFMTDAEAGIRAMRDAVHPGGTVAACVWDYASGMTMLRAFWDAALENDLDAPDEGRTMRYCAPEELAALWRAAGLLDVETREIVASAEYESFDDFWEPFPTGIGPSGAYCASLDADAREQLRGACLRQLGSPRGPFELTARAWFVRGTA